ncbi:hypothetical protein CCR91_07870 [Thiorhodovibrio winogradskyi]|nr:hypothetical protein [Thiorhodovibrio winogradskyi]
MEQHRLLARFGPSNGRGGRREYLPVGFPAASCRRDPRARYPAQNPKHLCDRSSDPGARADGGDGFRR